MAVVHLCKDLPRAQIKTPRDGFYLCDNTFFFPLNCAISVQTPLLVICELYALFSLPESPFLHLGSVATSTTPEKSLLNVHLWNEYLGKNETPSVNKLGMKGSGIFLLVLDGTRSRMIGGYGSHLL